MENPCAFCRESLAEPTVACAKGHALHRACFLRWKEFRRLQRVRCVVGCQTDYEDPFPADHAERPYRVAATIRDVPRGAWTVVAIRGVIYYRF